MADGDVGRVDGTEVLITGFQADLVDLGLVDDRIDRDGGLAGSAVTNDELTLAATDRDHGIDGHDAGEERLVDRLTGDDAGSDALDRVSFFGLDGAFAVHGITEGVNRATEQRFADGNGKQVAGGEHLVAFAKFGDITEDHATDFVFLKIEGDADGATGELDHLVIHDVREAVDFGDAVGDGADGAGVLFDRLIGKVGDLGFDLFEDGAHGGVGRERMI